jgi:hypothetical protein
VYRFLRELQAENPDGVDGEIVSVNHVVRSEAEMKAEADQHYLVFVKIGEETFVDVVDSERKEALQKGDQVHIGWTTTTEGDGMPLVS